MNAINAQFETKTTLEEDILVVHTTGKYSLTKAKNLFKIAIDLALLHNKTKILIDVTNVTGYIPFLDRFDYSEFLSLYHIEHAIDKIHKMAVKGHEPIIHKDRFGELVAVNRGTNVRVFTNINEASIWLKK